MAKTINIHEAKTHFSKLVWEVSEEDQEYVICRAGRPVAKLIGLDRGGLPRTPGGWKDKVVIHDDFDTLPANVAAAFQGKLE